MQQNVYTCKDEDIVLTLELEVDVGGVGSVVLTGIVIDDVRGVELVINDLVDGVLGRELKKIVILKVTKSQ